MDRAMDTAGGCSPTLWALVRMSWPPSGARSSAGLLPCAISLTSFMRPRERRWMGGGFAAHPRSICAVRRWVSKAEVVRKRLHLGAVRQIQVHVRAKLALQGRLPTQSRSLSMGELIVWLFHQRPFPFRDRATTMLAIRFRWLAACNGRFDLACHRSCRAILPSL